MGVGAVCNFDDPYLPLVNYWSRIQLVPRPRYDAISGMVQLTDEPDAEALLFLMGGLYHEEEPLDLDMFWTWHPKNNTWKCQNTGGPVPAPHYRASPMWVVVDSRVYVVGGTTEFLWPSPVIPAESGEFFRDGLFMLDVRTAQWSVVVDGPQLPPDLPLSLGSSFVDRGKWYLFGGLYPADISTGGAEGRIGPNATALNHKLWEFDPDANQFSVVSGTDAAGPGAPGGRIKPSIAAYEDDIVVLYSGRVEGTSQSTPDLWVFNRTAEQWRLVTDQLLAVPEDDPTGPSSPFVSVSGAISYVYADEFVIMTGNADFEASNRRILRINMANVVAQDPSLSLALARDHSGLLPVGRPFTMSAADYAAARLYVFGGLSNGKDNDFFVWHMDGTGPEATLHVAAGFDWETSKVYGPRIRRNHAAAAFNDTAMVLFGGKGTANVYYNDMWLFNNELKMWTVLQERTEVNPSTMPAWRDEACVLAWKSEIVIVFGGDHSLRLDPQQLLWMYNITSKTWRTPPVKSPWPEHRYSHFCEWVDHDRGRWVSYGGSDSDKTFPTAMWQFDMLTESFEILDDHLPVESRPPPRSNSFGGVWNGALWVLGVTEESKFWKFDFATRVWTEVSFDAAEGTVPVPRDSGVTVMSDAGVAFSFSRNVFVAFDLATLTATIMQQRHARLPSGANQLYGRNRETLVWLRGTNSLIMMDGMSVEGLSYQTSLWEYHFGAFCSGTTHLEYTVSNPVIAVNDGSWAMPYRPWTDCEFVIPASPDSLVPFDQSPVVHVVEVRLGRGAWLAAYRHNSTTGARVLARNFTAADGFIQLEDRVQISATAAFDSMVLRFVSSGARDPASGGFTALVPDNCPIGTHGDPLLRECISCEAGTASGVPAQPACTECRLGYYEPNEGSFRCLRCPEGYFTPSRTECIKCPLGSFSALTSQGNSVCTRCDIRSFANVTGSTSCVQCPDNHWVGYFGAVSSEECSCEPGFYRVSVGNSSLPESSAATASLHSPTVALQCNPCPSGAICAGGAALPIARAGYFQELPYVPSEDTLPVFYRCSPGVCLGGPESVCHPAHAGFKCASCAPGYAPTGLDCRKCPSSTTSSLLFFSTIFLAFTFVSYLLYIYTGRFSARPLGAPSIVIDFLQVLWLFSLLNIDWPSLTLAGLSVGKLIALNPDFLLPGCSVPLGYWSSWRIKMLIPFFIPPASIFMLVSGFAVYWRWNRDVVEMDPFPTLMSYLWHMRKKHHDHIIGFHVFLFYLLYVFLGVTSLEPLSCKEQEDGEYFVNVAPNVICYHGEWMDNLPAIVLFGLLYTVGIPAFFVYSILSKTNTLDNPVFVSRFGRLLFPFKERFYWWNIVLILRKLVLILILSLSLSNLGTSGAILLLGLASLMLLEATIWPYKQAVNNVAEIIVSFSLFLILLLGLMYFSRLTQATRDDGADVADWLFGIYMFCVVVSVVALLVEYCQVRRERAAVVACNDSNSSGEDSESDYGRDSDDGRRGGEVEMGSIDDSSRPSMRTSQSNMSTRFVQDVSIVPSSSSASVQSLRHEHHRKKEQKQKQQQQQKKKKKKKKKKKEEEVVVHPSLACGEAHDISSGAGGRGGGGVVDADADANDDDLPPLQANLSAGRGLSLWSYDTEERQLKADVAELEETVSLLRAQCEVNLRLLPVSAPYALSSTASSSTTTRLNGSRGDSHDGQGRRPE